MLFVAFAFAAPQVFAQVSLSVGLSVHIAPPALPVYTQPVCPGDGYIWTPGYWSYGDDGYYWVPGVWVRPPHVGFLWTPAYWGYDGGVYVYHSGYWGQHVGFYGGINYGCGYGGVGFGGGMWSGGVFRYNTAVNNVNTTIVHNTYVNNTVVNNTTVNRTSFNGPGGVAARPNNDEQRAMNEHHENPTSQQLTHQQTASQDRNQLASVNHGRPSVAAMNRVNGSHFDAAGHRANNAGNMQGNEGRNPNESNANHTMQNHQPENGTPNANVHQQNMEHSYGHAQPNMVRPANQNNNHYAAAYHARPAMQHAQPHGGGRPVPHERH